jgi:glycosyltransferase involved in cell wall biosynthesis
VTAPADTASVPLVSIGVPVYNGSRYLREALDSLLAQTLSDFDLLISDNASTDGSAEIGEEYARRDPRVRLVRQPRNIGGPRNWTYVARHARGRYFKWASGNDICHPEMLARCVAMLERDPGAVLAFPRTRLIDAAGREIREYVDPLNARDDDPARRFEHLLSTIELNNAQNGVIRTAPLLRTGLEAPYPASDITLLAELALHGRFVDVPAVLFSRRVAEGATTLGNSSAALRLFNDPLRRHGAPLKFWRSALGRLGAVWRSPVTWRQKLHLSGFILRRMRGDRDLLWRELVSEIRLWLGPRGTS